MRYLRHGRRDLDDIAIVVKEQEMQQRRRRRKELQEE
jgi:hypothetical protein